MCPQSHKKKKIDLNSTTWMSAPCQHVVDKTKNFVAEVFSKTLCFSARLNLTANREKPQLSQVGVVGHCQRF